MTVKARRGNGSRGFIGQFVYDQSQITPELIDERFAAATDPRLMAQPAMDFKSAGMPEELWRDARLTRLPHETLIMWGLDDRVMPVDGAFILLKQIPRSRLLVLSQCGHWIQWEHADEFHRSVLSFLTATS